MSVRNVEANRKVRRKLKDYYEYVAEAMALDAGAGTQYGEWLQKVLLHFRGDEGYNVDALRQVNEYIKRIDEAAKYLGEQPKLAENVPTNYGTAFGDSPGEAVTAVLGGLRSYADQLSAAVRTRRSMYGRESDAQFNVVSPRIVETLNFDAACFLHGRSSGKRHMPWCGGMSTYNYESYGGEGRNRYIVFPKGPKTEVVINNQKIPWSDYAFTVSVEDDSLNNINDPNNEYPSSSSFDRDGAEAALDVLRAAGIDVDEMGEEEEEEVVSVWSFYNEDFGSYVDMEDDSEEDALGTRAGDDSLRSYELTLVWFTGPQHMYDELSARGGFNWEEAAGYDLVTRGRTIPADYDDYYFVLVDDDIMLGAESQEEAERWLAARPYLSGWRLMHVDVRPIDKEGGDQEVWEGYGPSADEIAEDEGEDEGEGEDETDPVVDVYLATQVPDQYGGMHEADLFARFFKHERFSYAPTEPDERALKHGGWALWHAKVPTSVLRYTSTFPALKLTNLAPQDQWTKLKELPINYAEGSGYHRPLSNDEAPALLHTQDQDAQNEYDRYKRDLARYEEYGRTTPIPGYTQRPYPGTWVNWRMPSSMADRGVVDTRTVPSEHLTLTPHEETPSGRPQKVGGSVRTAVVRFGRHPVVCEVADTVEAQAKGLQGEPPLADGEGMLFPYSSQRRLQFHMGSVAFPIDIVFVRRGRIARIVANVQPGAQGSWGAQGDAVVEVPGGWCARAGIAPCTTARVKADVMAPRKWPRKEDYSKDKARQTRDIAYALKEADPDAIEIAAEAMAQYVPIGATLVPIPTSAGDTWANAALAQAIARIAGANVVDLLTGSMRPSIRDMRDEEETALTPEDLRTRLVGDVPVPDGPIFLIDNAATTGTTGLAAEQAIGRPVTLLTWSMVSQKLDQTPGVTVQKRRGSASGLRRTDGCGQGRAGSGVGAGYPDRGPLPQRTPSRRRPGAATVQADAYGVVRLPSADRAQRRQEQRDGCVHIRAADLGEPPHDQGGGATRQAGAARGPRRAGPGDAGAELPGGVPAAHPEHRRLAREWCPRDLRGDAARADGGLGAQQPLTFAAAVPQKPRGQHFYVTLAQRLTQTAEAIERAVATVAQAEGNDLDDFGIRTYDAEATLHVGAQARELAQGIEDYLESGSKWPNTDWHKYLVDKLGWVEKTLEERAWVRDGLNESVSRAQEYVSDGGLDPEWVANLASIEAAVEAVGSLPGLVDEVYRLVADAAPKIREHRKHYYQHGTEKRLPPHEEVEVLYHASINASELMTRGFASELPESGGIGGSQSLSNWEEKGTSFTDDPYVAMQIARALKEVVGIANGTYTWRDVQHWAAADGVWDEVWSTAQNVGYGPSREIPEAHREHPWRSDAKPDLDSPAAAFQLYRYYLAYSKRYDPVFHSVDITDFEGVDERDVGVVAAEVDMTDPDISYLGSMNEWRVPPRAIRRVVPQGAKNAKHVAQRRVVYHGSDADLEGARLDANNPGYEGSLGAGVYVAFDPDVAEFYSAGGEVYEADLYLTDDEIFWLEPHSIEDRYDSILAGENVAPFRFELNGQWYTVDGNWDDSPDPLRVRELVLGTLPPDNIFYAAVERADDRLPDPEDWEEYADEDDAAAEMAADLYADVLDEASTQATKERGFGIGLDDIGKEVEAAGYKAVYVEGIRGSQPDSELLVFDPAYVGSLRRAELGTDQAAPDTRQARPYDLLQGLTEASADGDALDDGRPVGDEGEWSSAEHEVGTDPGERFLDHDLPEARTFTFDVGSPTFDGLRGPAPTGPLSEHLEGPAVRQGRVAEVEQGKSYVVLRVPEHIAASYPADRGDDDSPPHFTVLYVGEAEGREDELVEIVEDVLAGVEPFEVALSEGVEWFENHKGQQIAHKGIDAGFDELESVWSKLKEALLAEDFKVKHHDSFIAHSTLAYCDEREYDGEVPEGDFVAEEFVVCLPGREVVVGLAMDRAKAASRLAIFRPVPGEKYRVIWTPPEMPISGVVEVANVTPQGGVVLRTRDGTARVDGPTFASWIDDVLLERKGYSTRNAAGYSDVDDMALALTEELMRRYDAFREGTSYVLRGPFGEGVADVLIPGVGFEVVRYVGPDAVASFDPKLKKVLIDEDVLKGRSRNRTKRELFRALQHELQHVAQESYYARPEPGDDYSYIADPREQQAYAVEAAQYIIDEVPAWQKLDSGALYRLIEDVGGRWFPENPKQFVSRVVKFLSRARTAQLEGTQGWVDRIPGGLSDSMKPSDFDEAALAKGTAAELEHTSDEALAVEIAMDHLVEDPDYYAKLEKMERSAQAGFDALRPALAAAAQRVYDAWDASDVDGDWQVGFGGICHLIADALIEVLWGAGIEATTVSSSHEVHVYVVARTADGVFLVDIPHGLYETGGGYNWTKIPEVTFDASDVVVDLLSTDPNDIREYIEDDEFEDWPVDPGDRTAATPLFGGPTVEVEGRTYKLSNMWHALEGDAYRYLWALDRDAGVVAMWRASDGSEKLGGPVTDYPEVDEVRAAGQLNVVSTEGFVQLDSAMRRREQATMESLQESIAESETDYQKTVNAAAVRYFETRVQPLIDEAVRAAEAGATPIGFEHQPALEQFGKTRERQLRLHAIEQVLQRELTPEKVDAYLQEVGLYDEEEDIQASYWAVNDLRYDVTRHARVAQLEEGAGLLVMSGDYALLIEEDGWGIPAVSGGREEALAEAGDIYGSLPVVQRWLRPIRQTVGAHAVTVYRPVVSPDARQNWTPAVGQWFSVFDLPPLAAPLAPWMFGDLRVEKAADVDQDFFHGTRDKGMQFEPRSPRSHGHGLLYLTPEKTVRGVPQAWYYARAGQMLKVRFKPDADVQEFDPLNDPRAAGVMEELEVPQDRWGLPPYEQADDIAEIAIPMGYNVFRFQEPSVQGESLAVSRPNDLLEIVERADVTMGHAPGEHGPWMGDDDGDNDDNDEWDEWNEWDERAREASVKKVEYLKKQHPASAEVIDWLAAQDPTAPKYEALPTMWNALKEGRPKDVAEDTELFYATQPYLEWIKLQLDDARRFPPAAHLAEYLNTRATRAGEHRVRGSIKKRLPALRGAAQVGAGYEDPEFGSYVRREMERTIVVSDAWGLSQRAVKTLLDSVPATGDVEDDKAAIRQALDLIATNRVLVRQQKPQTIEALYALTESPMGGERPEGAIDHGQGVTEYTTHAAARAECGRGTKWCWAYASPQYWGSYSANNRIFRVDDPSLPRGPYGTVVSRRTNQVGETRDRNDKSASAEAKARIQARLVSLGLAESSGGADVPAGADAQAQEVARWAAEGLDFFTFNPNGLHGRIIPLERAQEFIDHGFTPEETVQWDILRSMRGPFSTMSPEAIAKIKEHPLFQQMSIEAVVNKIAPMGVLGTYATSSKLTTLLHQLSKFDGPQAVIAVEWIAGLREQALTDWDAETIRTYTAELQEAMDRGYLDRLVLRSGKTEEIPALVERLRNEPFPAAVLDYERRPDARWADPRPTVVKAWEEAGVPRALAIKYAEPFQHVGAYGGTEKITQPIIREWAPLIEAMVSTRVFLKTLPSWRRVKDIPGIAKVIYDNPKAIKRAVKLGLLDFAETSAMFALALEWLPYVEQRWVPVQPASDSIYLLARPEDSPDLALAMGNSALYAAGMSAAEADAYRAVGVEDVAMMVRFYKPFGHRGLQLTPKVIQRFNEGGITDFETMEGYRRMRNSDVQEAWAAAEDGRPGLIEAIRAAEAEARQERLEAEYQEVLPQLRTAVEGITGEERVRVKRMYDAYQAGDPGQFIDWVRTVVPGAFPSWTGMTAQAARGRQVVDPGGLIADTLWAMAEYVGGALAWQPSPLSPSGALEHVTIRPEDRAAWLASSGLPPLDQQAVQAALEAPDGLHALAQGFQAAGIAETYDVAPADGSLVLYRSTTMPVPRAA